MTIHVICGYTYSNTFIDNHFRYDYVYLIKHKFESFERFKEFKNEVEFFWKKYQNTLIRSR